MSKHGSITLDSHFLDFVDAQVASGRFSSEREVVHAALRLLEEHELRLQVLRQALDEGESSGPAEPIDFEAFLSEKRAQRRK